MKPAIRCFLVWLAVTVACLAVVEAGVKALVGSGSTGPLSLEQVIVRLAAGVALVCVPPTWWSATSTCWAVARGAVTFVPSGVVRRAMLLACGGVLAAGALAPVHASVHSPVHSLGPEGRETPSRHVLHGLPMPDRATIEADAPTVNGPSADDPSVSGPSADDPSVSGPRTHRVRPGESLWSIAQDDLGAAADVAAIDSRWRRIHALNDRAVTDPHLIHPGQRLRMPSSYPPPAGDHHKGDTP